MLRSDRPLLLSLPLLVQFCPPPLPEFVRTLGFCRGGEEVLWLVLSSTGSGGDRPSRRKAPLPSLDCPVPRKRQLKPSLGLPDVRAHR